MKVPDLAGRSLVGLALVSLLSGCGIGASPVPAPASQGPSNPAVDPTPTPTPTATSTAIPTPTPPALIVTRLAYKSSNPILTPGVVDVYAPAATGPWPVVVMLHAPGWTSEMEVHAPKVADLGFVVFAPTWGAGGDASAPTYDGLMAIGSQAACSVAFARSHAAEYGGDPATMIVFGHSGGANVAAMVAFARPDPTAGCLGGTTLGAIDALVVWEGDWILSRKDFGWDGFLAADPRLLDALTPWKHLTDRRDLKVVMLMSEHPGVDIGRTGGDPRAADSWLAVRDPSGDLRRRLEANGAFADGGFDMADLQRLFSSALEAQGNPVTLDVMPGSTHEYVGGGGWDVFLAAFGKAATRD